MYNQHLLFKKIVYQYLQ